LIYFIVGMSCSGKDYVSEGLPIRRLPSTTTRAPRSCDKGYNYVNREDISVDDFAELEEHCGNLYGTRKADLLLGSESVFKIIEPKGLAKLKSKVDCRVIYVFTPINECKERMLRRDGKITRERFDQDLVTEFYKVLEASDLLISGDDKGRLELIEFIKNTEGWLSLPSDETRFDLAKGELFKITRAYVGGKVEVAEEVLTKVVLRKDLKTQLTFDVKKPGVLYPLNHKQRYGIVKIERKI